MTKHAISLIAMLSWVQAVPGQVPVEWPVNEGGNGHWYMPFVAPDDLSWSAAHDEAELLGGYLATLTSQAENDFAFSLIQSDEFWFVTAQGGNLGPWIGGFQPAGSEEPLGGWAWVTGEPFDFAAWAPGQPNNAGPNGQDAIAFFNFSKIAPTWHDHNSSGGIFAYIVEWVDAPDLCFLADIDDNGIVGTSDLLIVIAQWGCSPSCIGDVDHDGVVGTTDLLGVLQEWGSCP